MVLIRMEALGDAARSASTALTEVFIEDMDGQLREEGVGDVVVGKHIGKMMGALGGRLGAYRDAFSESDLSVALRRNLYRGEPVTDDAIAHNVRRLRAFGERLRAIDLDELLAGRWR